MPTGEKEKNGRRGLVTLAYTSPIWVPSQLADVMPKSPRFLYGMREPT